MDPDRLCAWGEKIGITGGRRKLSTPLSPAVDNRINRCETIELQFIFLATMSRVPGHATSRRTCKNKRLPQLKGASNAYRVPKDD
jgi:hypothetical protein